MKSPIVLFSLLSLSVSLQAYWAHGHAPRRSPTWFASTSLLIVAIQALLTAFAGRDVIGLCSGNSGPFARRRLAGKPRPFYQAPPSTPALPGTG